MAITAGKSEITSKRAWLFMLFLLLTFQLFSQDVGDSVMQKVTVKEWNFVFTANTSGGGVGFQHGKTPDYFNKHFWEVELFYNRHPKVVRARNSYYENSTSFCYGKLYDLFLLRGGYGYQRTIHHKPYWGGVMVRYSLSAGFTLGMGIPTYLTILYSPDQISVATVVERYDPEKHNINNILGRASLWNGIKKITLRPGFYCKTGFIFEFSKKETSLQALEVGAAIDMIFPYLQQVAYNNAKPFYLCAYLCFNIGKKKGNYE